MSEDVLVFKKELLKLIGLFHGYTLDIDKYLSLILDPANNLFADRDLMEQDFNYKQIIAYVVLRHRDMVFTYDRGAESGEKRLIGRKSIGLGGHIVRADSNINSSNRQVYLTAAKRELSEEVEIKSKFKEHIVALMNDESTDVGKVHFGILHVWDLLEPKVHSRENDIANAGFMPILKLKEMGHLLEEWSKIALDVIAQGHIPFSDNFSGDN